MWTQHDSSHLALRIPYSSYVVRFSDCVAYSWDLFLLLGCPVSPSTGEDVPSFKATWYTKAGWYPWEASPVLMRKEGGVDRGEERWGEGQEGDKGRETMVEIKILLIWIGN